MGTRNLEYFFRPRSVAVIGASQDAGKVGHVIFRNFVESDFSGDIYPINPDASEILGITAFESVLDVQQDIDLAIVAVPPTVANEVVKECVAKGIPATIIVTAGYREIGEEGKEREEELQEIIAGTDTRVIGPNCLGVFDAYSGVDTLFLPDYKLARPHAGSIGVIAQSGAFGSVLLDVASYNGIGVSRFVSYGNAVDVTEVDVLSFFAHSDDTQCAAGYIEAVTDGDAFTEQMRDITTQMPVVLQKAGKSEEGSTAAESHTGSLAGSYAVYQGILKQFGCIEARNIQELFDCAKLLSFEQPLTGNTVAVVTNGGGFGVLSTDAIEQLDLELASFSKATQKDLQRALPKYAAVHNPLDVIGDADADRYRQALDVLGKDTAVDGILTVTLLQTATLDSEILDVVTEFRERYGKQLVVCMTGGHYTQLHARNMERNGVPVYPTPERAAQALQALWQYGRYLEQNT